MSTEIVMTINSAAKRSASQSIRPARLHDAVVSRTCSPGSYRKAAADCVDVRYDKAETQEDTGNGDGCPFPVSCEVFFCGVRG